MAGTCGLSLSGGRRRRRRSRRTKRRTKRKTKRVKRRRRTRRRRRRGGALIPTSAATSGALWLALKECQKRKKRR
tara:strand:- start:326 stop:550 length:225 start_codon:yes stop_codon:yes gene_type:complete